jgi:prefoldin subunit 5
MKDIQQVLRQKRAQVERLTREIDLLQAAEQTLREVAPLLADNDDEDSSVLSEIGDETQSSAAAAGIGSQKSVTPASPVRTTVPRWP